MKVTEIKKKVDVNVLKWEDVEDSQEMLMHVCDYGKIIRQWYSKTILGNDNFKLIYCVLFINKMQVPLLIILL